MLEVVIGFIIALCIGLTGVGGGTLTTPLLILALRVPPDVAVGTALLFSVLAKIPAGWIYWQKQGVNWQALRLLLAGGIPAAIAGSLLLHSFKFHKEAVLAGIGLIILSVAVINLAITLKRLSPRPLAPQWIVVIAAFIGLEVGFSSAGAGALGTLLLMSGTRLMPREVVGTDLWFGLGLSAFAGGLHAALGQTDWLLLTKLACGGLVGSLVGAWLGQRVNQRPFRIGLLLWLMLIGSHLILRGIPALAR